MYWIFKLNHERYENITADCNKHAQYKYFKMHDEKHECEHNIKI